MYPTVTIEGGPRERGRQYGEAARERVGRSVEAYREVFAHYAGWDWDRVREEAARFRAPVEAFEPRYAEELDGLAEGAALDPLDVLAINVRTEVMFAATARDASRATRLPPECSSLAVLPRRAGGPTLLAQNWDWLLHALDTVVVLEARQEDRPNYVTVVEAGLLAKAGMNSAGIGVATNALVTAADVGAPGVPYHVLLRAILDSETISDGLAALQRRDRASSANFLLGDQDGVALDVEAAPGDFERVHLGYPEDGLLLHTNHFVNGGAGVRDVSLWAMPDSPFRMARLRDLTEHVEVLDVPAVQALLADHATFPLGVCCHADPRLAELERSATLAAVVMDLGARRLWIADGQPCTADWREHELGDLLAEPGALREFV